MPRLGALTNGVVVGLVRARSGDVMTDLQKRIAALQTKAAEFELIASLATDPKARSLNERLGEELRKTIEQLQWQTPDRLFLLHQAEKWRHLAIAVADQNIMADLRGLAAEFEET